MLEPWWRDAMTTELGEHCAEPYETSPHTNPGGLVWRYRPDPFDQHDHARLGVCYIPSRNAVTVGWIDQPDPLTSFPADSPTVVDDVGRFLTARGLRWTFDRPGSPSAAGGSEPTWSSSCGEPGCDWFGPDRDTEAQARADRLAHEAGTGHRTWHAGELTAGMSVVNPVWETGQPEVLDVLAVDDADDEGMVWIHAVGGSVRVNGHWPVHLYTRERADLETTLIIECQQDLRDTDGGRD